MTHPAYNRGYFNQQLTLEMARTNRYLTPLSLIIFDIDHFKRINDTFGHLTGDRVLQDVTTLVQKNIRENDHLARWGGEEFAVLIPGVERQHAVHFAEKIRLVIEKFLFADGLHVTCSFGVSAYVPGEMGDSFLKRVDQALYMAKKQGRNRCAMIAPDPGHKLRAVFS